MASRKSAAQPSIPEYEEINQFLEAAHFRQRTRNPLFFVLRLEDTYPDVAAVMPPFRKKFFLMAMAANQGKSNFLLNEKPLSDVKRYLAFQSPGHLLSWKRDQGLSGYLVYFKAECLAFFRKNLLDEFPFFDLLHSNFYRINASVYAELSVEFEALLQEEDDNYWFKEQVVYARLLALLYKCKNVYVRFKADLINQHNAGGTTQSFVQLVNNYFVEKRTVKEYADLLHITPGHLNDLVKKTTGNTASGIIAEKLMQEAKNLVGFTNTTISEIAYQLNFTSPAHFHRFFKKHSGQTPLHFRKSAQETIPTMK